MAAGIELEHILGLRRMGRRGRFYLDVLPTAKRALDISRRKVCHRSGPRSIVIARFSTVSGRALRAARAKHGFSSISRE